MDEPREAGERKPQAKEAPSGKLQPSSGWGPPLLSLMFFVTLHDVAIVDSMALRGSGRAWEARVAGLAPVFCVLAWTIAFYTPIARRLGLTPWRGDRPVPRLVRHAILWVALTSVVASLHCLLKVG